MPSSTRFLRVPANCPHSASKYPSCLSSASEIRPDSPRTYGLLNSGVVVLNPSNEVMRGIIGFLDNNPSAKGFKFPDQDTLAEYFKGKWKPLPYIYNTLKTLRCVCEASVALCHKRVNVPIPVKPIDRYGMTKISSTFITFWTTNHGRSGRRARGRLKFRS